MNAIKILSFVLILVIFGIPLALNLLVLYDDLKRRRRRREELSNLLPVLKGGKVNRGKLEGSYRDLPVEMFFKDYLTNHAFDHSLFHIRAKRAFPFEFKYKQGGGSQNGDGGSVLKPSSIQYDDLRWEKPMGQILRIYHEVGTSQEEGSLQVVGTIRANSQEEFFLRPENVAVALAGMEAIYRAADSGGDEKTDGDKTDQHGACYLDDNERPLSEPGSGGGRAEQRG